MDKGINSEVKSAYQPVISMIQKNVSDTAYLKDGLGKYGPYVRCNCGHFLKPDEI